MKKLFTILAALLLTTQVFASSALNFGNLGVSAVSQTSDTNWAAYTPTLTGFGTPSSVEAEWRRLGDTLLLKFKFTFGVTTGTEARLSLPTGLTSADTAKIPSIKVAGFGQMNKVFAGAQSLFIEPSVSYITFGSNNAAGSGLTKRLGNELGSTGEIYSGYASIPISSWSVSGGSVVGPWTSYSPTLTSFGTTSAENFLYRRSGDSVEVKGVFTAGTLAAALGSVSLPSGLTIDSTKVTVVADTSSPCDYVGVIFPVAASQEVTALACTTTSTGLIYTGRALTVGSRTTPNNANAYMASTQIMHVNFKVPVVGW